MTKFSHLHQHTSYSLLDGLSNIKDLLQWVKDTTDTDPSCAMTDHGNMSGVLQFYKYAIQFGVKPILGYEAYITARSRHTKQKGEKTYHLTLLAKDFEGYQNLCRLNYLANSEGYYYKPRIDHEILEQHSKGVIAMSGCLGAELQQHILNGDMQSARSTIEWYLRVFKGNYFIEIQNHGLQEQQLVNPVLMQLAKEYGIGMVATNDGHYIKKADSDTHDTLLAIQTKARLSDDNRFKFPCDEFYTKSAGEMELFLPRSTWGDEIYDNTVLIAESCNVELPIGSKRTYRIPQPKLQEGDTSDAKIYRLVNKGLRKRYGADLTPDKIKRAEYELSVIKKMGFTDYFLIVQDYVNWAKKQGIAVGLGRGSAAGSIIAYAIGITDVDPIKYGLIFERFLNPDRISMPDVDSDISDTGREKVITYVREKYGEDHVSMIGTYGAMLSRSCLKDVARSMGLPHDIINILTGMIPVKFGKPSTLMEAYNSSQEIRDFLDVHEDVKRAYYYALNLEGTIRSSGVHASGLIISDTPLTDLIPLTVDRSTGKSVSQYDMHDVEDIGLVKMDFLGLRTLTFLEKARDLLLEHKGVTVVFNDVQLDDPKVYKLLSRGDNKGIFQLEGSGISQASKSLKPERFEDIVALTSLYRPGPMDNIGTYIKRRHGLEEISYKDFPQSGHLLSSILAETYGIPVYQEQIMHISTSVAGYTLAESDTLRKAMGKKSQSEMDKQRSKFIEGAKIANNIDTEEAERLFELLNKFANYGFNKCAHAQTRVMLADGSQISLSRAYREQPRELMAMWSDGTVKPHAVSKIVKTGVKELLKIRTKSGRVIKVTPEHRLLTTRGYIEAREMTLSDELITLPRVNDKQRAARRANMTKLNQSVTQREKASERMIRYQAGRSMEDKVSHMRHMHMIHPHLTRNGVAAMHERIKFLWANDPEFRKRHIERSIASVRACYNTGPGYGRCSIASNGMWCASSYEREMCEWLISHGVQFEMHKVLRNGRMCDFYFDGLYWEMDGMDRTYQYFADKYGDLPFIVVTPEDYKAIVAKHLGLEHTENGDLIVSIEPCESAMTYDIEMMPNGPLNYIANGIVSHNSHAVAYSMLSYQTAWLKVNHPDIFYAALLSVEYGDQDKVAEYIQDARRYGIKILPPDINKSQREFAIADGVIYFGLSAIKSLGVGAIDVILEARQERQFDDLIDITQRISKGDLNSRALGMLIKAGALDALGDRSQQLASIDILRKPLPKRNPKPRELVDDYTPYTPIELLKLERDAIGLYVSGNPLDSYPEFKAARSSTIAGLNDWCDTQPSYYQNRVRGIVAGTISQITKIQTKRGQTMAKLLVEDETAVVEVIVFAGEWEQMTNSAVVDGSALFYCDITPDDDNGSPKLVGKRILTHDDLVWLPRIAFITLDMVWVDTNTLETLAEDFRGTTEDARAIVRIDTGYDIVSMDLGDLRVPKDLGDKLATYDGVTVSYTYDPKALLQFVGAR